jgi:hypothetical protein
MPWNRKCPQRRKQLVIYVAFIASSFFEIFTNMSFINYLALSNCYNGNSSLQWLTIFYSEAQVLWSLGFKNKAPLIVTTSKIEKGHDLSLVLRFQEKWGYNDRGHEKVSSVALGAIVLCREKSCQNEGLLNEPCTPLFMVGNNQS